MSESQPPGKVPDSTKEFGDAEGLNGLELMQAMRDGRVPPPPIGKTLNFTLTTAEEGHAVFEGDAREDFYNPLGIVHGGWAATLLDSCMGCAIHTTMAPGGHYTTLELKINYIRAISTKTGRLCAEGRVVHRGRRTATAEGRLVDAAGKLYAHGTTTCIILQRDGDM